MSPSTVRLRLVVGVIALVVGALTLTGCTPTVALTVAPDGINPTCAEVIVRLPETIGDLPLRQTNAQGTGAWGSPATVTLRCGVPVPGPTTELCSTADGVDWIADDSKAPSYRFTTYGRNPAIEVIVNQDEKLGAAIVTGRAALEAVAAAVKQIPATKSCL